MYKHPKLVFGAYTQRILLCLWRENSCIFMKTLRLDTGDPEKDSKQAFIERARNLTGRNLSGIENLEGLNYDKLKGMSEKEMGALLDLVKRMSPEEKGDVSGGISNALSNLGEIKDVVSGLRENYDLDTQKLIDSILKEKDAGWVKSNLVRAAAKTAGIYNTGGRYKVLKG